MSSSSDIEKLFDHFGGDANAYQEIGRENEARSARTRWPLLVTLDLTQPTIPAVGQRRESAPEQVREIAPAIDREDTTPKDAASVTRAKAPLFTRSHRRDIPPVAAPAKPGVTPGASRFGVFASTDETAEPDASASATPASAPVASVRPAVPPAVPPAMPPATPFTPQPVLQPIVAAAAPAQFAPVTAAPPVAAIPPAYVPPPAVQYRAPAAPSAQAQPATQAWAPAPARSAPPSYATPTAPIAPVSPVAPASILGKLFAPEPAAAAPQAPAPSGEAAPLQSVFARLRGTSGQTATAPADATSAAAPAASNSWLVNGPRRS
ncbi:hypothetical protein P3T18_004026 [Paraburkholderia sp. GAS199]|uniref:cellulose biosynthesis protein BcsP n=1 Tax=Paraburkholderia sp. GAS199 TaxID=3035126 RepID=UPI003D1F6EE4